MVVLVSSYIAIVLVVSFCVHTHIIMFFFFFQAEDGIRVLVRSRGLGDVYKRQLPLREYTPMQVKQTVTGYGGADKQQMQQMVRLLLGLDEPPRPDDAADAVAVALCYHQLARYEELEGCLLYTSDAADERSRVDLGGRRIIKKKKS